MGWESRDGGRLRDRHVHNPLAVQSIANPRLLPLLFVKKIVPLGFLDLSEKIFLLLDRKSVV